jgi:hypothetical protein
MTAEAPLAGKTETAALPAGAEPDGTGERQTPPVAPQDRNAPEAEHGEVAAAAPRFKEVTLPAGTVLTVALDTPVASDSSRVEDAVHAHVTKPVRAEGAVVLPAGSDLRGVVTSAVRSGKVKGRARVAVQFDSVTPAGDREPYAISTAAVARTAPATKKEDTLKVVAPAAGGAIIGRIAVGRKGAAIGTAVGAGAGGAVVVSTRGKEVRLAKGARLSVRLSKPLTVRLPQH